MKPRPILHYFFCFTNKRVKTLIVNETTDCAYFKSQRSFGPGIGKYFKSKSDYPASVYLTRKPNGKIFAETEWDYIRITRKEWMRFMTRNIIPVLRLKEQYRPYV